MANIILASHGELAKGMLNSAAMIIGNLAKDVEVYCLYPGQNPQDYAEKLRLRIA
ncbi:MAG: PTS sugar transporter subunit IIA, partial [Clostridium sp.]